MYRSSARCRRISLLLVALALTAAACGTSGRALRDPDRNIPAPTRNTPSTTYPATTMSLVADGFAPGAGIPDEMGCGGRPPTLRWEGVPAGTQELALALIDSDESDPLKRIHWLVAGIDPAGATEGSLPSGPPPPGVITLANGQGVAGYSGPCPAAGRRSFNFMVFALPSASGLNAASAPVDAMKALEKSAKGDIAQYTGVAEA